MTRTTTTSTTTQTSTTQTRSPLVPSPFRRAAVAATATFTALMLLTGCGQISELAGETPEPTASATPTAPPPVESQFTQDGTFQSHVDIDGLDFVYTIYPTKSTPRTNLWFPRGSKYFSFTFQAYDLDQDLRDKFKTKRKVYLDDISVESTTTTTSGVSESPYVLDETASQVTFDPQPVKTKYGMLVTSPKGAFELRNQEIGDLADDTRGVELTFRATVNIQRSAGSKTYYQEVIRQKVPISIFASDTETEVAKIPVNAN